MNIHSVLIRLAFSMIVTFGGIFIIRFFKTGELLLDLVLGASAGIILLIATFLFEKTKSQ